MRYGVVGPGRQVPEAEVERILALAAEQGILDLDTAATYGEAESVLGRVLARLAPDLPRPFALCTKTIRLDRPRITRRDAVHMAEEVQRSLDRLGVDRVDTLLVKAASDLTAEGGEWVAEVLTDLVDRGLVARLGLSAYLGDPIDGALDRAPLSVIQLPLSVVDQRPLRTGLVDRLVQRGVDIHVRSVLLQGVLAAPPESVPPFLAPLSPLLSRFQTRARQAGLSPAQAAVWAMERVPGVARVVVGVHDEAHLRDLARPPDQDIPWEDLAVDDPLLVSCPHWPAQ
jgi:aryl-alcohol dehydrogenase-like predicted oxidoreductase